MTFAARTLLAVPLGVSLLLAVQPATAAPSLSLTATPAVVTTPGTPVAVSWTSEEVTVCTASGGWAGERGPTGMESVTPAATTTFVLVCSGPTGGVLRRAVTVTVKGNECEQIDDSCTLESATDRCDIPLHITRNAERVRVTVNERTAGLNVRWQLERDGRPAPSCEISPGKRTDCGPLGIGDYTIVVLPVSGTGAVRVHTQHLVGCASTRIDCDQTVTDKIDPAEESDLFRFSAAQGEVVRVATRALGGGLVPEWRLLTPAGAPESTCGGFRRIGGADCGPLAAGEYQIQVKDEQLRQTGDFALGLQRLTAAAACDSPLIPCTRPTSAELDPGFDTDLFRFTVSANETVRVAVNRQTDTFVPDWRLLTAAGLPAPACAAFTTLPTADCGPLAAGDYQVHVKDELVSRTGTYDVAVAYLVNRNCCGDGRVTAPEQCDPPGTCCSPACRFEPQGTSCRRIAGDCDVAETCTGAAGACPRDVFRPSSVVCRPSAGGCDVEERCTGQTATCPVNGFDAGAECRAAAGPCDVAERCTDTSAACPQDLKSTAVCRLASGPCDATERCDGVATICPADVVQPASTVCRPAINACDVAEVCTGAGVDCPPNLQPPGVCGDGCANAGEACGEPGLAECGRGRICGGCGCLVCAEPVPRCGPPLTADGTFDVSLATYWELPVIGHYTFTLAWDPAAVRLETVDGGVTPGFAPPLCGIDGGAGIATCVGTAAGSGLAGPDNETGVARARFARLVTGPAEVRMAMQEIVGQDGAPGLVCSTVGTCTGAACATPADCDDGDRCTDEECTGGECTSTPRAGFPRADCELEKLLAPDVCGSPLSAKLARVLTRRVTKARALTARASTLPDARRRRKLLRRAERQLTGALSKAARDGALPSSCSVTLIGLLEERVALVAGLAS